MQSILGKRLRNDEPAPARPPPTFAPTFATTDAALAQQRAINPRALMQTINTMNDTTLRATLFHAASGQIDYSQMLFQIFDLHHARLREEQEAAVKAQKPKQRASSAKRQKSSILIITTK
jgi:hypothetical protein